jgi:hypothetical protein
MRVNVTSAVQVILCNIVICLIAVGAIVDQKRLIFL